MSIQTWPEATRRHAALMVSVAMAAIIGGLVVSSEAVPGGLRGLVGVVLVIGLPGFALLHAVFPRTLFDLPEAGASVIALGIGQTIVGGFILDTTPLGLTAGGWALELVVATVLAALASIARSPRSDDRHAMVPAVGATAPMAEPASAPAPTLAEKTARPARQQAWMLGLAAIVVVLAFVVARLGAEGQVYPGFTQLWMLPDGDASVTVGVRNEEGSSQSYTMATLREGVAFGQPISLTLADGESWQQAIPVEPAPAGTRIHLEALLLRPPAVEPYRRVTATLGELETPPAPTPTPP